MIYLFFQCFLMNGHFYLCHDCEFLKVYPEISSLTRIFHEKAASTGSRVSFLENRGPIKPIKERGNAEQTKIKKKKCSFANHHDFPIFLDVF